MKIPVTIFSVCLTLFLLCSGCTTEEEVPPPVKKIRIVKPVKRPPPERAETPIAGKEFKPEPEKKEAGEVKPAVVEKNASKKSEKDAGEKETPKAEETGYYVVKKGDSLSGIAGRAAGYKDPLKWPVLYRINMDKLDKMERGEDFPDRYLPEGVKLKINTPEEVKENLKKRPYHKWVVNILSATTRGEVIAAATKLINNGCPVYITTAKVKGKDWMRLRVGFFKKKKEADAKGREIMAILNLSDLWITKIDKKEFEEFGGY